MGFLSFIQFLSAVAVEFFCVVVVLKNTRIYCFVEFIGAYALYATLKNEDGAKLRVVVPRFPLSKQTSVVASKQ